MQRPAIQTPTTTQSDSDDPRALAEPPQRRTLAMMATTAGPILPFTLPHIGTRDPRPTLPPLTELENTAGRRTTSPLTTPPISRTFGILDPFSRQTLPQSLPQPSPTSQPLAIDSRYQPSREPRDPFYQSQHQSTPHDAFENPLKRAFGAMAQASSRYGHPLQPLVSPAFSEPRTPYPPQSQTQFPVSSRSSYSDASTPSATHSIASFIGQGTAQEARAVGASGLTSGRLSLFLRQQPRAARAGPDGKDRRAIDPPPVLQLMIDDFDIDNDEDMNELKSSYFVVHCRLVSATSPKKDLSTAQTLNEDGSYDVQRLLLGTTVASPFFCQDDPDPDHMPTHPVTSKVERPPSPSSRFIQSRSQAKGKQKAPLPGTLPGSFFIFADLSVRKAGEYRLEFCLMKIEATSLIAGQNLPIINTVHSQVFKVVNAKDFDQVQPSTELVRGLLDRGAGFPLKLKKGIREGQRRRQGGDGSEDDEEDEDGP